MCCIKMNPFKFYHGLSVNVIVMDASYSLFSTSPGGVLGGSRLKTSLLEFLRYSWEMLRLLNKNVYIAR